MTCISSRGGAVTSNMAATSTYRSNGPTRSEASVCLCQWARCSVFHVASGSVMSVQLLPLRWSQHQRLSAGCREPEGCCGAEEVWGIHRVDAVSDYKQFHPQTGPRPFFFFKLMLLCCCWQRLPCSRRVTLNPLRAAPNGAPSLSCCSESLWFICCTPCGCCTDSSTPNPAMEAEETYASPPTWQRDPDYRLAQA